VGPVARGHIGDRLLRGRREAGRQRLTRCANSSRPRPRICCPAKMLRGAP
jgi:hypothetical protein